MPREVLKAVPRARQTSSAVWWSSTVVDQSAQYFLHVIVLL